MTEQEVDVLEQIWEGKTSWGPEWEETLDDLATGGYIEIAEKRRAAGVGQAVVDGIVEPPQGGLADDVRGEDI
jgi:hypothetical protein